LGDVYLVTLDRSGQTTTVLWNTATTPTSISLNAIAPQAILIDVEGNQQTIAAENNVYVVELPGAVCSNGPQACFIGGPPRLVVETGSAEQRVLQLPLVASPTPAVAQEPLSIETAPPTSEAESPTPADTSPAPPTLTPTPALQEPEAGQAPPSAGENIAPIMAVLPDPNLGTESAELTAADPIPPTAIPPVTIATVLSRPDRIFWLFIIGLIVFTVSYGVQVVIWYRMRR
jgi:hypothetical protein